MRSGRSGGRLRPLAVAAAVFCTLQAAGEAPSAAAGVDAWTAVRSWVDAGRVPGHGRGTPAGIDGAAVQLSFSGRLIGGDSAHAAAGDVDPLAKATRGALSAALANSFFTRLPAHERVEALSRLELEVEVAGIPEPLTGPLNLLDDDVHPGLDGLAVRRDGAWSIRFPSRLRSIGKAATGETLRGMLFMHGVHEAEADVLRRTGEVAIYRVPTLDLRQSTEGRFPVGFERGRSGDFTPVTSRTQVLALADRLAVALTAWFMEQEKTADTRSLDFCADTWDPHRDEWTNLIADDRDIALASLALAKWARQRSDHPASLRARELARTSLADLHPEGQPDPADLALASVAASEAWPDSDVPSTVRRPLHRPLLETAAGEDTEPARAVATLALAQRGDIDAVRASVEDWIDRGPDALVSTLPWSLEAVRAAGDDRLDPHLELLREILLSRQLDAEGGIWGPEAAGAIALSRGTSALGMPSLRAAWAAAALMADAPPSDGVLLRSRLLLLATHLRRRMIDDGDAATFATPNRAQDRIRLAPWDERVSIEAQSLAVLTALEIAEALQENEP